MAHWVGEMELERLVGPGGGGGPALPFLSVCTSLSISFSCGVPCIKASSSSYANEVH